MTKRLYVGNISYSITEEDLERVFGPHGTVVFTRIIKDRETGRSKGFAFVEMETEAEARQALDALNGQEVNGRMLTINEARPRTDAPPSYGARQYSGVR